MFGSVVSRSTKLLDQIVGTLRASDLSDRADTLCSLVGRIRRREFHLAIVGAYNRGKSTLINALLGDQVLPVGNRPTTKCVTLIRQDGAYRVDLGDGREGARSFEDVRALHDHLTGLWTDGASLSDVPVSVYLPNKLGKGVVLVDTPGVIEAHADVTRTYLDKVDGILFVLSVGEQLAVEMRLCRELAARFGLFCAVNRIDEPNTAADLEHSTRHLLGLVEPFTPHVHFVSAYQGLRARQWARDPAQLASIVAGDRRFAAFAGHEELLETSRLPELERALYAWLRSRLTWQLLYGLRLARQGLDALCARCAQVEQASRDEHSGQAPALREKAHEARRRQRHLESTLEEVCSQMTDAAAAAWDATIAPTLERQASEARSSVRDYVRQTSPTGLRDDFSEMVRQEWSGAIQSIRRTVSAQAKRIGDPLGAQVQRDFADADLPRLRLRLSKAVRSPWPASRQDSRSGMEESTADILAEVQVSRIDGFLGDVRRGIANSWTNLAGQVTGFRGRLLGAFEREAQAAQKRLAREVKTAWKGWREGVIAECDRLYEPAIATCERWASEAAKALRALEERVALDRERAQAARERRDAYAKRIAGLEARLEARPVRRPDPKAPGQPMRLAQALATSVPLPAWAAALTRRRDVRLWAVALFIVAIGLVGILAVALGVLL